MEFDSWMVMKTLEQKFISKRNLVSSSPLDNLAFHFRFVFRTLYSNHRDYAGKQVFSECLWSPERISIPITLKEFLSPATAARVLDFHLKELEIWGDWDIHEFREQVIHVALHAASKAFTPLSTSPRPEGVMRLKFDVSLLQTEMCNGADEEEGEVDECCRFMVPADECEIEKLERKRLSTLEAEEACAVCLDEFCCWCEALELPCSHFFHGDCIREWLRTSHYCPVCRYEMPALVETNADDSGDDGSLN